MINSNKMSIPTGVSQRQEKFLAIAPPGWEHQMPIRLFVSKEKEILMEHCLGFVFTWKKIIIISGEIK